MSANLNNIVIGSKPGVNMNIKGEAQFEFSNDANKSNGGGSINLFSKIDSSSNKNKSLCRNNVCLLFYIDYYLRTSYKVLNGR